MNIWVIIVSAIAGATISEVYHARMWHLYQQGKREGRAQKAEVAESRRIEIHR